MRRELPDGYVVEYRYESTFSKRPPRGGDYCVETLVTRAIVGRRDRVFAEAVGEAILSPEDSFSLQRGRDVALGRAIKKLVAAADRELIIPRRHRIEPPVVRFT